MESMVRRMRIRYSPYTYSATKIVINLRKTRIPPHNFWGKCQSGSLPSCLGSLVTLCRQSLETFAYDRIYNTHTFHL